MDADRLYEALAGRVEGRLERDVSLSRFTTYRLGGKAALFLEVASEVDLTAVAEARAEAGDVPVLPLGRGSNLVVSDAGYEGLVVHLGASFGAIEAGESAGDIRAGGAASLPVLANWCARRGLAGLEFAIAIPGSVGGGVRMNAGAHGGAIADTLTDARVFDLASGSAEVMPASSFDFAYRHSALLDHHLVIAARFTATVDDAATVKAKTDEWRRQRAATQPGAAQNAGSVFKNPSNDHAGRLVEAAGLKGFSVGGASVSKLHANFFIATDGARAQDVFDLVHTVKQKVADAFGVELEPEVRFVGSFEDPAGRGEGGRAAGRRG